MKPMTKNMWREIGANKGRFIAIILIILLGTQVFVGIKAAGPSLNDSLQQTIENGRLSDVELLSSTGFTKKDITTAEKVNGAKAQAIKFKYVLGGADEYAVALYGYDKATTQNKPSLRSGHLPRKANQVVLDQRAKTKYGYKLGQTFKFAQSAGLKRRSYTIVGFADSPQYIDNAQRGSTNVGDGTVRFFAYVPQKQLNLSVDTMLLIRFKALQNENTFSTTYKDAVAKKVTALKRVFKTRRTTREQELLAPTLAKLNAEQAKLTAASKQLATAKAQVKAASGGAITTTAAITKQEATITAATKKLTAAKAEAKAAVNTTYTWQTRDDLPGFSAYGDASDRIAAIANVFPVFFFLIAALITFTTITRMVEEARGQIGTFKALGFSKWRISQNYLVYALMASVIGAIIGGAIGNAVLPRIVLALYSNYIPLSVVDHFQWGQFALALGFSLLATVGAAIIVTRQELTEKPAALMRPKAPKSAKRILLERITPLWSRLNFNQKVSYRNLFRYKSRMFMTIIGIAGGTALILTGFGIKDSISASGTEQFGRVFTYQATVALDGTNAQPAEKVLQADSHYKRSTKIAATTGKVSANGEQVTDANFYVPASPTQFKRYIHLTDYKSGQALRLADSGVILTQKIATTLGVKQGDTVTLTTTAGKKVKAKVSGVTRNYMSHFVYYSKKEAAKLFGKAPASNTLLVQLKHQTEKQRNKLAHQLLDKGKVLGTSYEIDQAQTISTMSGTLGPIVFLFIFLSGILSFVVLYNLTNINVSERIRELSTIKVLGFYDGEVTMYIARENIVLTLMGIVVGYFVGNALTAYILHQAATALIVFPLTIYWVGYVVATVLMIAFTAIVMFVTHKRLQRVDMVEALKSNE